MIRPQAYLTAFLLLLFHFPLHGEDPAVPAEAVALLPDTKLIPTRPGPEEGSIEETSEGWRMLAPGKLAKSYNLSVSHSFDQPIAKGQVCLFVIRARTLQAETPGAKGRVTAAVQNTKDYSTPLLWRNWEIGREWETSYFSFVPEQDLPEGCGVAKVNAGEAKQIIEVASFQIYRFPPGFDLFNAPRMKTTYAGREPDAPWRKEAEERISRLRRGKWTIRVKDEKGQPVQGAKVRIAMQRHLFGFGSAVDVNMLSGLGTSLSPQDQMRYRQTVDELCSRIVPENGLRPGQIDADPVPDKPWESDTRRRTGIATEWTYQWAQDRHISSRGHYLAWCYVEPWARDEIRKGGPAALLARYDRHFAHVLPFCAPFVEEWDALNHPVPFNEADALYNVIGPDVYPQLYEKIRCQTDKLLFVNEDAFNPERAAAFRRHVEHMIAKGQTPDGCGFQSHFSDHAIPGIMEEWAMWNSFGALTRHLTVTEYDLTTLDDQLHADHLRDMLTLAYSHPQMTGFVIWGFWEKRHWKPAAALFKADWTERPAVKVWRDLVKGKWWTDTTLQTDANGEATTDAWFGWYEVNAESGTAAGTQVLKHHVSGGTPGLTIRPAPAAQ